MLALIPLPFLRTDSRGTILNLNEPAARLLNLSRPHAIGKTLSLCIAADRDSFVTTLAGITPKQPNREMAAADPSARETARSSERHSMRVDSC
jgi:PAS domain-containing protein